MIEVREYVDAKGRSPYRDWLIKLDAATIARVIAAVLRMEGGNFSNAKTVGVGVAGLAAAAPAALAGGAARGGGAAGPGGVGGRRRGDKADRGRCPGGDGRGGG